MTESTKDYLQEYKKEHNNYYEMVRFCTEGRHILNNEIFGLFSDWECVNGEEFDEDGEWIEVYQFFIISDAGAEMFKDHTNEIIYYSEYLDMYLLAVTHYGTCWEGVPANWK